MLDLHPRAVTIQTTPSLAPEHLCGWEILFQWYQHADALQMRTDPMPTLTTLPQRLQNIIRIVMHESNAEWVEAGAEGDLLDFARWLRLTYFTFIAQTEQAGAPCTQHTLLSAAPEAITQPSQATHLLQDPHTHGKIEHRLQFQLNHPEWLGTDELDTALQMARLNKPNIYFATPISWHEPTHQLYLFNDNHIDSRPYNHCFHFVIHQQHWHLVEVLRISNRILIFTTLEDHHLRTPLYEAICTAAGTNITQAHLIHTPQQSPSGLCGWVLLWQLFARLGLDLPTINNAELLTLDLSPFAQKFNACRAALQATFEDHPGLQPCSRLARAIRVKHLNLILTGRVPERYNHAGANEDQDKDKQAKAAKTKQTITDPLFVNDPWAKAQQKPQQTRWEDLQLVTSHPFRDNADKPITQLHRLQHTANRTGVILATKQHLPDISKITTPGPLGVILPGTDKNAFGEAAQHVKGPYELVLEDPAIKTSYKRLVMLFVVKGDIKYSLPTPTTKCEAANFVEMVAELDSRLVPQADFQKALTDPTATIKRLLSAIHRNLDENITLYGLRRSRSGHQNQDSHIQIICRIPGATRSKLLEASGEHALLVRDFIDKANVKQDTSVLPKFIVPTAHNLHELRITTKGIPGAAGITLARRGLALRVWANQIAEARRAFLADDARLTKDNLHIVPHSTFESSGWPNTVEASSVIKAVAEATGQPPIPTRAYRVAGVFSWTLAFQTPPQKDRFTIEVGGTVHEILLVPTQQRHNPKATQHQQPSKGKKANQAPKDPQYQPATTFALGNPNAKADQQRLDRLEQKVGELEGRQDRFERRLDERFDGVESALRQLLQRSETPRSREQTGETPPPKLAKLGA